MADRAAGASFSTVLPVAWSPERDRRGAAPDRGTGPRCGGARGCPFPAGRCPDHAPPPAGARPPSRWARIAELADAARREHDRVAAARGRSNDPVPQAERRLKVAELYTAGLNVGQIARRLVTDRSTVARDLAYIARAAGVPQPDAPAGTAAEIARQLGTGPSAVQAFPQPPPARLAIMPPPAALCACGCGEPVPPTRPNRRFASQLHRTRAFRRRQWAEYRELRDAAKAATAAGNAAPDGKAAAGAAMVTGPARGTAAVAKAAACLAAVS